MPRDRLGFADFVCRRSSVRAVRRGTGIRSDAVPVAGLGVPVCPVTRPVTRAAALLVP